MRAVGRLLLGYALVSASAALAGPARAADVPPPAPPSDAPPRVVPCAPPQAPCPPRDACDPCFEPRRGPVEFRDEWVLSQPRLTLPATSPDTLGCGRTSLRGCFAWTNSFGWRQVGDDEHPSYRFYLVDGETRTFDVTAMRGVRDDLDVGLRLPVQWRGGGVLDPLIDDFHDATSFITKDNGRSKFEVDKYRVNGHRDDGSAFDADQEKGLGLGNLEGIAKWRFHDGGRDGWSAAAVGRLRLPTGTEPFDVGGVEAGLQVVAAKRLAPPVDFFGGVGGTWFSKERYDGIRYEPLRGHAFVAFEWRPVRWGSLVLESDYATRLVSDVAEYAPEQWYLNLGAKIDVARGTVLELAVIENLIDQQTTADFGVVLGLEHRW